MKMFKCGCYWFLFVVCNLPGDGGPPAGCWGGITKEEIDLEVPKLSQLGVLPNRSLLPFMDKSSGESWGVDWSDSSDPDLIAGITKGCGIHRFALAVGLELDFTLKSVGSSFGESGKHGRSESEWHLHKKNQKQIFQSCKNFTRPLITSHCEHFTRYKIQGDFLIFTFDDTALLRYPVETCAHAERAAMEIMEYSEWVGKRATTGPRRDTSLGQYLTLVATPRVQCAPWGTVYCDYPWLARTSTTWLE